MSASPSSTAALDRPAPGLEQNDQSVTMVTLDFDNVTFQGSTSTAFLFQLFGQRLELLRRQRHAADQGDPLPFASLGFPSDADDTVTRW